MSESKPYRRIERPIPSPGDALAPPGAIRPWLRLLIALAGTALLLLSGQQLLEVMAEMPPPNATRTVVSGLPELRIAWSTVAGAVLLPVATVLCFVAFGALRGQVAIADRR